MATPSQTAPSCQRHEENKTKRLRDAFGRPLGFESFAIVGSSGLLLSGRMGQEIDGHELVVRLNLAPVGGFEQIVGRRTSLRVVNSEAVTCAALHEGCVDRRSRSSFCPMYGLFFNTGPNKPERRALARQCGTSSKAPQLEQRDVGQDDPVLRRLHPRSRRATNAMTGAWAVALAMRLCPNGVRTYGLSSHRIADEAAATLSAPYHYYDLRELKSDVDDLHGFARALSLLAAAEPECLTVRRPEALAPPLAYPTKRRRFVDPFADSQMHRFNRSMAGTDSDGFTAAPIAAGQDLSHTAYTVCKRTGSFAQMGQRLCCVRCPFDGARRKTSRLARGLNTLPGSGRVVG